MPDALYTFRVDSTLLRRRVRDMLGHFQQGNQAIKRANEQSVVWLGEHAAEKLSRQIKREPDMRNRVRLVDVVLNPEASIATIDGFQFMVANQVASINRRTASYYRSVEWGSSYWVGERVRLFFYGGRPAPLQAGFANKHAPWITITHPVPAYLYARVASESFVKGRMWWKFAYAELRRKGIDNVKASG